jgi:tetratricopeptide (TPR) repeat protein
MSDEKPSALRRILTAPGRLFLRWWREATGPLLSNDHPLLIDALLRRLWVLTPVLLLALLLLGALGFYLFTGWRARDLTAKALASAEAGSWHFARRQVAAAANLRPDDPTVQRANAVIESRLGNPEAVAMWEAISGGPALTENEFDARAEIMTAHGDDAQFEAAIAALGAQGSTARVAELRSLRSLRRGDMEQAIARAREAAAASDQPALRLRLLRLLAARHGLALSNRSTSGPRDLAAAAEMTALIDGLAGTPSADEALALGLEAPYFPAGKKAGWSEAAWRNPIDTNPALLPAAGFLAASGKETPEALYEKLEPLYVGSPPLRQAAFTRWMLRCGLNEQALVTASAAEAAQDEALFGLRASALGGLGRWEEVLQLSESPGEIPESARFMIRSLATREQGRPGEADELFRTALRTSAAEGRFGTAVEMADQQGFRALADEAVVDLCGDADQADGAFGLARDRFSRRGQFATLDQAYAAARQSSPDAKSVRVYERYREILGGSNADLSVTAEALAADPTHVSARFNHALALLKAGQTEEALAVFDEFDVLVDQLPPGLRAVSAAVLHANGDKNAVVVARRIDPDLLTPDEYALIAPLRHAGP